MAATRAKAYSVRSDLRRSTRRGLAAGRQDPRPTVFVTEASARRRERNPASHLGRWRCQPAPEFEGHGARRVTGLENHSHAVFGRGNGADRAPSASGAGSNTCLAAALNAVMVAGNGADSASTCAEITSAAQASEVGATY
jgi:hypothetical protein